MFYHCHMTLTKTSWVVPRPLWWQRPGHAQSQDALRQMRLSNGWLWRSIPENTAHRTSHEEPTKRKISSYEGELCLHSVSPIMHVLKWFRLSSTFNKIAPLKLTCWRNGKTSFSFRCKSIGGWGEGVKWAHRRSQVWRSNEYCYELPT